MSLLNLTTVGVLMLMLTAPVFAQEPKLPEKASRDFYVTTSGNDRNPGTKDQPFARLERAREVLRGLPGGPAGATVWLAGGRYELDQTIDFLPKDSGQAGLPVVYRSLPGERAVLSGGRRITGWRRAPANLPGLSEAARGRAWMADLPRANGGVWRFRQLWKDGTPLTRARWPDHGEGSFTVTDALIPDDATLADPLRRAAWTTSVRKAWQHIRFPGVPDVLGASGGSAELVCRNAGRWATMRIPITAGSAAEISLAYPAGLLSHYWKNMFLMSPVDGNGWIEGSLGLLDQPGEWHLDEATGRVVYLPPEGEDPNACQMVAPRLATLVRFDGQLGAPVQYLELRDLVIEHADWQLPAYGYRPGLGGFHGTEHTPLIETVPIVPGSVRNRRDLIPGHSLPAAVDLVQTQHCQIFGCTIARVGATGIGLGEGCHENTVDGCTVEDAGGHGIHVGLPHGPICLEDFAWSRPADEPRDNLVTGCHVHHVATMDWGAYGILNSYAQRTRIIGNHIEQLPYCGLATSFSWFAFPTGSNLEVIVEGNHIHHVMLKLFDGGAVYNKDALAPSSVLRRNHIHDVGTGHWQCNGIFLDDGSAGFNIADNVIYAVATPLRFNNCGKQHFTWGTNYFGRRAEATQIIEQSGSAGALDSPVLRVEDAPPEVLAPLDP